MWKQRLLLALVIGLAACTGCTRYSKVNPALQDLAETSRGLEIRNGRYILEPPDEIQIIVADVETLRTAAQIRPDGYITMPVVGDVYVEGLTPNEARDVIAEEVRDYVIEPEVNVIVTGFNSKRVHVFGEVGRAGSIMFTGDVRLADAIAATGGLTPRAAGGRVRVVRGDRDCPQVFKVSVSKMIKEGDDTQNLWLRADDRVYVPPNFFAKIGYAIDNVLFPFRSLISAAASVRTVQDLNNNNDNDRYR